MSFGRWKTTVVKDVFVAQFKRRIPVHHTTKAVANCTAAGVARNSGRAERVRQRLHGQRLAIGEGYVSVHDAAALLLQPVCDTLCIIWHDFASVTAVTQCCSLPKLPKTLTESSSSPMF